MSRALIIGAGGVAGVVIHKCCQNSEVFTDICIASRTKSKCDKFKEELQDKTKTNITTAQVNADNVPELVALMKEYTENLGAEEILYDDKVAKISIVGAGMESHAGVATKMFEALYDAQVNIQMISTSEIKVSVLIDSADADKAVSAIHSKFFD